MMNTLIMANGLLVIFILLSLGLYQQFIARKLLSKIKMKQSQHAVALRVIFKNIEAIDSKLQSIMHAQLEQQNSKSFHVQNDIEQQYERAKKILKNGANGDLDSLHSCDMTEEEIELLTDLMPSGALNHKSKSNHEFDL